MNLTALEVVPANRLLKALPEKDAEKLLCKCERVELSKGRTIYETGDAARHVYFPSSGVITLLSATEDGESVEVGMIGNEGTTGVPVIMHARRMPYRATVQFPLDALRCEATVIREQFNNGGPFTDLMLCYAHALFAQVAQSAVCNRFHTAEQRFCRWLLCIRDRVPSDTLELTQESLAFTLGTQRSMVSTALTALQRSGLINYNRGSLTVLDQRGIELASCECYEAVNEQICRCRAA